MTVYLLGEVLFNSRNPFDPPDFIFIDDAAFQPSMDKLTVSQVVDVHLLLTLQNFIFLNLVV